jgi:hypothetical protein
VSLPPSRHLPDRPSLEQLGKRAREHLDTLRAADPAVKLAAAQHALAREYGFESWPRLVYTAIAGRPHSGFERAAHAAAPLSTRTDSIRSGPGMPARVGR